jgi:hypothetical protein
MRLERRDAVDEKIDMPYSEHIFMISNDDQICHQVKYLCLFLRDVLADYATPRREEGHTREAVLVNLHRPKQSLCRCGQPTSKLGLATDP